MRYRKYCISTQDPALRARFNIEAAANRVYNYLHVSTEELKTLARISGVYDIHDLTMDNLITVDEDIARYTGILHAGTTQ